MLRAMLTSASRRVLAWPVSQSSIRAVWRVCSPCPGATSHQQSPLWGCMRPPGFRRCASTGSGVSSISGSPLKKYNLRPLNKDDVDTSYARSSGPGGQNVNKVNTKVDMRWEMEKAGWVPEDVKEAIRTAEKNRFTKDGVLVLTSTKHRNQAQNFDDALAKLQEIIDRAVIAVTPTVADPETIKRVKANIKAGQENRLQNKKKDSLRKSFRSNKNFD